VAAVSQRVLSMRYSLLPVLYTLLNHAHVNGGTVLRSLMFNFPTESDTWNIDQQFMWGSQLLVTPVLTEGAISVKGYFSGAVPWFDAWNLTQLGGSAGTDGFLELPCSLEQGVLVHIAGGSILPTQKPALTTAATRLNPFILVVAPNLDGESSGALFWDDGSNLVDGANALNVQFSASVVQQALSWSVQTNTFTGTLPKVSSILFPGFASNPSSITLGSTNLPSGSWVYDSSRKVLSVDVSGMGASFGQSNKLTWA
jgi:alpha-glucosidase (family GH31 glycosyl hydrolase)